MFPCPLSEASSVLSLVFVVLNEGPVEVHRIPQFRRVHLLHLHREAISRRDLLRKDRPPPALELVEALVVQNFELQDGMSFK